MWHDKLAADKKAYLESIQIPDGLKDMWRAKVDAGRKKKNKKKWIVSQPDSGIGLEQKDFANSTG